ncbi:MAG: hypothetical protein R2848_10500 [Thermomicrobiales bacterium]
MIPIQRVRLDLISLNHEAEQRDVELVQDPATGDFVANGLQLTINGWWEIDVLVRRAGLEDEIVPFFFLIPDPNINGFDAPQFDSSSDEAQALFECAGYGDESHQRALHRAAGVRFGWCGDF